MRQRIKEHAKVAFKAQYWKLVAIILVGGLLVGGIIGISSSLSVNSSNLNEVMDNSQVRAVFSVFQLISVVVGIVGLLYVFFFGNVIEVGLAKTTLSAYQHESVRFTDLFSGLKQYKRNVGTMALYTLFVGLGFMCFIVPGIIVALGLFEVPYLLADDPSVSGMSAIRRSWENMKGHKGELFVFELSFLGWELLSAFTMGALAIFYVGPYKAIAEAGYYRERHPIPAEETPVAE